VLHLYYTPKERTFSDMIEEISIDTLLHWILESDNIEEIHEWVETYLDEDTYFPVFD